MLTLTLSPLFTVGDLVACDFPYSDGGEKTRVCPIVAVYLDSNEVVVAYGTSNLHLEADVTHALTVFTTADCEGAGLHKATRFQVDRRLRLLADDPRLRVHRVKKTAKVGRLNPEMTRRLVAIYRGLPQVSIAAERKGIHPPCRSENSRRCFLGRRRKKRGES